MIEGSVRQGVLEMERIHKYKAFISYSHDDEKWAQWLHRSLERYRIPKHLVNATDLASNRLTPIFRDREELASASSLTDVIEKALAASEYLIVVCSAASMNSRWVNAEIEKFIALGGAERILCLIVGGEPPSCFPQTLRNREPLAADARKQGDGRNAAKLKIISGLIGSSLGDLQQREVQRRHHRLVAVSTISLASLLVMATLTTLALLARQDAQKEAATSAQVVEFMVNIFEVSDPSEALGNTITAREILDQGARRIEFELEDQPAIRSTLLDTMGRVYMRLGLYEDASKLLERGLVTRQTLYGRNHPQVARSQANLGELLGKQAELEEAAKLYQQAITIQRGSSDGPDIALSLVGLADIRTLQGNFERAEELLREAVGIQRQVLGQENLALASSLDYLGMSLWDQGKYEEAEPILRESLAMRRKVIPGGIHPDLEDGLNNLAVFLLDTGEYDETESLFRESLAMNRRLLGNVHPHVASVLNNLAFLLHDVGDYRAAEANYEEALSIYRKLLGEKHPSVAAVLNNLAFLNYDMGDQERALETSREALAVYREAYPGNHPEVTYGMQNLAGWLVEAGDYEAAEPLLHEALEMNKALFDPGHVDIAITRTGMAVLYLRTGRAAAASVLAQTAYESLIESYGPDHWRTAWALATLGASLTQLSRYAESEQLLLKSYEGLHSNTGARPVHVGTARRYLAELYMAWDRPEEAARYSDDAGSGL
jgi:tetratricopeptide (TPR) repeat protein